MKAEYMYPLEILQLGGRSGGFSIPVSSPAEMIRIAPQLLAAARFPYTAFFIVPAGKAPGITLKDKIAEPGVQVSAGPPIRYTR